MLLFRTARPRSARLSTAVVLRPPVRSYYSAKGTSSRLQNYVAATGGIGTLSLWWLTNTRVDAKNPEGPAVELLSAESNPTKAQVTEIISQEAYSHQVRNVAGVDRYDGTQVASNSPCEDDFMHGQFPSPRNNGDQWMAWGVFDGHLGWQTADLLTKQLLPFVRRRLGEVASTPDSRSLSEEAVQCAIAQGFLDLDESIMNTALDARQSAEPLQEKVKKCLPAFAGSCALLSLYDPATGTLHVAYTGDSRAVLGQRQPDGAWKATPLSVDQTGSNPEEIARVYKEHPGEEGIVQNGRVLGLMVSRAFGDSQWKWPLDVQEEMKRKFYGPAPLTPRFDVRTPPYLTAEPVVTSTKLDPSKPSFLIMATDGMWDMLSNQQAVNLVGKWLAPEEAGKKKHSEAATTAEPFDFGHFWNGVNWQFTDERTIIQDDNAAVHLLIAARLAFSPPHARRVRDDITVQVVFFNTPGLK
ncbi:phosphatase 2C-like domain-containing protein [Aspergillus egyptiacus]|nr:phosphatase 2C-like domain-containing protein [Aspergillus egyptiacus]